MLLATPDSNTKVIYQDNDKNEAEFIFEEFIDVKGWRALGNKLVEGKVKIQDTELIQEQDDAEADNDDDEVYNTGDTVDLDPEKRNQGELFD